MVETILLIDDSSISRKMFKRELPDRFRVLEAGSGSSGIEIYKNETVDLIFLDLTMPEMDGFETLEILKGINPEVKVIILSADVQETSREKAFGLGAMEFMNKPVKNKQLKEILEKI